MAFVRPKARILERSITAGNGPYALAGAVDGSYRSFSSFMSIGDAVEATVVEPGVAFWSGVVTYSATNQITLTAVEETSGSFGSGTKEIFAGGLASRALLREDMAGAIVTGGTSTAYTVTSFRTYDTLARLDGKAIAFTPHATNGATVTMNVDGLGNKPLRAAPSTELLPGVLIRGTPYMALYNHSDQVFYLHGLFGNPFDVPLGSGLDYWLGVAPNSAFAFPVGQAISRATYSTLFDRMGTTFGAGDGSTTFNLPDKRGRVSAAVDNMGGSAANRLPGYTMNVSGGAALVTLSADQLPLHAHSGLTGGDFPDHVHGVFGTTGNKNVGTTGSPVPTQEAGGAISTGGASINHKHEFTTNTGDGLFGNAHSNLQPTIACNYIMRVL